MSFCHWFRGHREPSPEAILLALYKMEIRLTQEFANLKAVIDEAVVAVDNAVAELSKPRDNPVDVQAAADTLKAAVTKLTAALPPVV